MDRFHLFLKTIVSFLKEKMKRSLLKKIVFLKVRRFVNEIRSFLIFCRSLKTTRSLTIVNDLFKTKYIFWSENP